MMTKQIFGWTHPEMPINSFVGYITASTVMDGEIEFTLRPHGDKVGNCVSLTMPAAEALKLAKAIMCENAPSATAETLIVKVDLVGYEYVIKILRAHVEAVKALQDIRDFKPSMHRDTPLLAQFAIFARQRAREVVGMESEDVARPVVYSRPECLFHYCPNRDRCEGADKCESPLKVTS